MEYCSYSFVYPVVYPVRKFKSAKLQQALTAFATMQHMEIIQPDDWHCHLRDGSYLKRTVADTAARFHRAIVMPNLATPVLTVDDAVAYHQRILKVIPKDCNFTPLLTLYLTESTTPSMIQVAAASTLVYACKLYPAGATTHSQAGVSELSRLYAVFAAMEENDLPLLIHGESIDPNTDIFDREKSFLETSMTPLIKQFPNLRIVLEHISTKDAVDFILDSNDKIAATITAHHLLYDRNMIFKGGIRPHYYCLPILKRREHQQALRKIATSGHPKFFLGTDSAPHTKHQKENHCGCAGVYSAHAAIELYARVFEQENALDKLETFASVNGANFYGLPINKQKLILEKKSWQVPEYLSFGETVLVPLAGGETLEWQIQT